MRNEARRDIRGGRGPPETSKPSITNQQRKEGRDVRIRLRDATKEEKRRHERGVPRFEVDVSRMHEYVFTRPKDCMRMAMHWSHIRVAQYVSPWSPEKCSEVLVSPDLDLIRPCERFYIVLVLPYIWSMWLRQELNSICLVLEQDSASVPYKRSIIVLTNAN